MEPDAALSLRNADGPSLALQALSEEWDGPLKVGEIVNTDAGPSIGVDYGDGAVTTFLATGVDLANLYPVPAERLLDTRSATSRADQVVNASSASPFDSIGRLKGGAYIDIAVAPVERPRPDRRLPQRDGLPADGGRLPRGVHARDPAPDPHRSATSVS